MIKCAIFDLDHTVYDFLTPNLAAAAAINDYVKEHFGIEPDEFDRLLKAAMRRTEKKVGSEIAAIHSRTLRYQTFLEDIGESATAHAAVMGEIYWETFYSHMQTDPAVKPVLDAIRDAGIKVGICTDMTATVQFKKIIKLGLERSIDFVVTSEEAGLEKPTARILDLCVEKAGCDVAECVFVGDHPKKDVLGPMDYGMEAVWSRKYDYFRLGELLHFEVTITKEQEDRIKYRYFDYESVLDGDNINLGGLIL